MAARTVIISTAIVVAAVVGGCSKGVNLDSQPGPHVKLDTLRPTADFYERVDKPLVQSGSSLAGLSRENWAQTTFYVPISGTEHKPTYTTDKPHRTDSTARQRGEFPTQLSAAQNSDYDSSGEQAIEGLLAPLRAGWDIVWMVPKMVATPPGRTVSSPRVEYERGPNPTNRTNGGLRDGGLGVVLMPLDTSSPPEPTTPAGEPETGVAPAAPGAEPEPVLVAPPAPPPPLPSDNPAVTPRLPGGAIGGSDSPRRRDQRSPKPPATEPERKP